MLNRDDYVPIIPSKNTLLTNYIRTDCGIICVKTSEYLEIENVIDKKYIVDELPADGKVIANILIIIDEKLFSDLGINRFPSNGQYIKKDAIGYDDSLKNYYMDEENLQILVNHVPYRSIIFLDKVNNDIKLVCQNVDTANYLLKSTIKTVYSLYYRKRGYFVLHSAAVSVDGDVYAFVGRGRSGKTTLYMNLLNEGFKAVNDDMILLKGCRDYIEVKALPLFPNIRKESLQYIKAADKLNLIDNYKSLEDEVTVNISPFAADNKAEKKYVLKGIIIPCINSDKNSIEKVDIGTVYKIIFKEMSSQQELSATPELLELYNILKEMQLYKMNISSDVDECCKLFKTLVL